MQNFNYSDFIIRKCFVQHFLIIKKYIFKPYKSLELEQKSNNI